VTRHVLIRAADADRLVAESALPAEANLHDALAANPKLLPAEDLGLGRMVVIGRESSLASGYADLILADDLGQVCLVEVKKEGNPDTRQVVAQLLDYAASLWGRTLDEVTDTVVRPYLRHLGEDDSITLEDFMTVSFARESAGDESDVANVDLIIRNLAVTLERGTFTLVVAAPQIPAGVERALEYLNARGLKLYALEVDYFRRQLEHEQVECFVPRLSVRPPITTRSNVAVAPIEREDFLEALGESLSPLIADTLDAIEEAGAQVGWNSFGATIKVALENTRQVGLLDKKGIAVATVAPKGFAVARFDRAQERLAALGIGVAGWDGKFHRMGYAEATQEQLRQATGALVDLCRELTDRVRWQELATPHVETFTRNDYNVWLKSASGLEQFRSQYLRGRISRLPDGEDAAIQLAPLAADQPGWKPQLVQRDGVWPAGENTGRYRLVVTAIGSTG
jgi:hypothetical protein